MLPLLKQEHREARLAWATEHAEEDWYAWVHVDEKWMYGVHLQTLLKLPPGDPSRWRDVEFRFTPQDMLG